MSDIADRLAHEVTRHADHASSFGSDAEREQIARLVEKERALRDVAELIAHAGADEDVLATIVHEASRQIQDLPMTLSRFVGEDELLVVASRGGPAPAGTRIAFVARTLPDHVRRTGLPFRVDDYRSQPDAEMARRFGIVAGVSVPIIVEDRAWGMFTVTSAVGVLPPETEVRLAGFAQLVTASFDSIEARTRLRATAEHDEAMRSIQQYATGAPISDVAGCLVEYAARLGGIQRVTLTLDSGVIRSAANPVLSIADTAIRPPGSVAFAVMAQQRHLGELTAQTTLPALPDRTVAHLTDLCEVTGRMILAITNRQDLNELVDEQASLRRIAELAARGVPLSNLFESVVDNAARVFGASRATLLSYEAGAAPTVVAIAGQPHIGTADAGMIPGGRGRADRLESFRAKSPIAVESEQWGVLTLELAAPPPDGILDRLKAFADLTAVAIANTNIKESLTRSRARIVAAGDDARRRLQRDVHDGAQQRLVHAILSLKLARDRAHDGEPVADLIDEAIAHAEDANRQLRDVVRGILPAALTRAGLVAGIQSFITDIAVPVRLDLAIPRLPPALETTGYFTVAEAVTNAVKHADASTLTITANIAGATDELVIVVADDGVGGADPSRGSGLTGLMDRVEAGNGTLAIASPVGQGTTVTARLRLQPHLLTNTGPSWAGT